MKTQAAEKFREALWSLIKKYQLELSPQNVSIMLMASMVTISMDHSMDILKTQKDLQDIMKDMVDIWIEDHGKN